MNTSADFFLFTYPELSLSSSQNYALYVTQCVVLRYRARKAYLAVNGCMYNPGISHR